MPQGSGTITGIITDRVTGKPIAGVKLSTDGKAGAYGSYSKGDYVLSDTAGRYTMKAVKAGYRTYKSAIEIIDSKTVRKDFSMQPIS